MFGTLKQDLRADILAQSAFSSIPVVFGVSEDNTLPQIRISQSASNQPVYLDGDVGLKTSSLTVNIFTNSIAQQNTLVDAFYERYHGFNGQLNSSTNTLSIAVTSVIETVDETRPKVYQAILPLDILTP